MSIDWCEINRREFIRIASIAAGMFALPGCSDDEIETTADASDLGDTASGTDGGDDSGDAASDLDAPVPDSVVIPDEPPRLPSLGGAPDTADGRAIAAFVDTIIPGAHRDPTGAPGAIDVNAASQFFDPELPAAPFVPMLVLVLDGEARSGFSGQKFIELEPEEREEVVGRVVETVDVLGFAVLLARLAYYSTKEVGDYLGYPGPNTGYVDHPDFSFGDALTTEVTTDGNYP